jgi:putative endonuclease
VFNGGVYRVFTHSRQNAKVVIPTQAGTQGPRAVKQPCVYILASQRNGTLYVGVTNDIIRRVWEHRTGQIDGFTKLYGVHRLVHAEFHETMTDAIAREKRIKRWRRAWKLRLIETDNPQWRDLYDEFVGSPGSPPSRG